jgi:hypothetical protein
MPDPFVMLTDEKDGSAKATVQFADENHRFSISQSGELAVISYEETLAPRGEIWTNEPHNDVWELLAQSHELTQWLDDKNLDGVKFERNT